MVIFHRKADGSHKYGRRPSMDDPARVTVDQIPHGMQIILEYLANPAETIMEALKESGIPFFTLEDIQRIKSIPPETLNPNHVSMYLRAVRHGEECAVYKPQLPGNFQDQLLCYIAFREVSRVRGQRMRDFFDEYAPEEIRRQAHLLKRMGLVDNIHGVMRCTAHGKAKVEALTYGPAQNLEAYVESLR